MHGSLLAVGQNALLVCAALLVLCAGLFLLDYGFRHGFLMQPGRQGGGTTGAGDSGGPGVVFDD